MPIEEIDDYPEKMTEFELHWASVNAALGGAPATDFLLAGDFTLADFSTLKDQVVAALTTQEGLANNTDFARADRDQGRGELRQRLILFSDSVRKLLKESRYVRALPDTPAEQAEAQKQLDAWDDAAHIWGQINTDQPAEVAPAMILRGNYALAQFQADIATMRTRFDAVKAGERAEQDGRGVRDELLDAAYRRMIQYRERLPLVLEPDDPLLASMPKVTPSPGSTPDAVVLSGYWDEGMMQAVLSWTASSDQDLQVYEIRGCIGATYDEATSQFLANYQPGVLGTPTLFGLIDPGDTVTFKVFVHLTTGNKAGSNPVTITRM